MRVFRLLPLTAILLAGCNTSPPEAHYQVRVVTSPPAAFSGTYGLVSSDGNNSSKTVDGQGTATYDLGTGQIVSAVFQKKEQGGTLSVEVLKDGQQFKVESTSAEYGVVQIAGGP